MRLENKTALITGGTSGIGQATVELFAAEGAQVAFTGRREALGAALAERVRAAGGQALFIPADMTVPADCQRAVDATVQAYGRLDILFNNAGIVVDGTAEELGEADWQQTFEINVFAVWRMCKLALPLMRAQGGGAIVNNASDWGVVAGREAVVYCASKGAVIQMTKAMALDHAHENIRVNAVCPGDTYVDRYAAPDYFRNAGGPEAMQKELGEALPLGRMGRPEEIAQAVLFLASDESSFVTGSALLIDGGNTAA